MNSYIYFFFIFGACFGAATFPWRHLFSEGPHKAESPVGEEAWLSRVMWIATCTLLWPVMALSGLNTAWILARRRRAQQSKNRGA